MLLWSDEWREMYSAWKRAVTTRGVTDSLSLAIVFTHLLTW